MPSSITADGPGESAEKVRENRLRRAAQRQGLVLMKSARRDPRATTFGTYMLVREHPSAPPVFADETTEGYGKTLDEIEVYLTGQRRENT